MTTLRDRVIEIMAGMAGISADELDPADSIESLGLDSLDLVEMVVTIEDELGITIDRDDFNTVASLQDAIEALDAALAKSATTS